MKYEYFHKINSSYISDLIINDQNILDLNIIDDFLREKILSSSYIGLYTDENLKVRLKNHKHLLNESFISFTKKNKGKNFEYIIVQDILNNTEDIYSNLHNIKKVASKKTRIVFSYIRPIWLPLIKLSEILKLKNKTQEMNYISNKDIKNFLSNHNLEIIKNFSKIIIPIYIPIISNFINKYVANLPIFNLFCLRQYIVARKIENSNLNLSTTVIIPCRNESGNIEKLFKRMKKFCNKQEIILIEGNSKDNTWDIINNIKKKYLNKFDIKILKQPHKGKKDAVMYACDKAKNDLIVILDGDDTINPSYLKEFYDLINLNYAEFLNGSRLVYPMEKKSMKFLNYIFNRIFGFLFSLILSQHFTDTLCGTKMFKKSDYKNMVKYGKTFLNNDPFGDFFLIFASNFLNLKIKEVPVRYESRKFGDTNISRFSDGWLLFKNLLYALFKFKLN